MTHDDTTHVADDLDLAERIETEITGLTHGLSFAAREGVRREGELITLEVHPRWEPGDRERGEPEERLDLEILIEPHAPVRETAPGFIEGIFDACGELVEDEEPNLRRIGRAKADQLRQQLDGPRLSTTHLSGLTFLLSHQPSWVHLLPPAAINDDRRGRFENVDPDSDFELSLIGGPGESETRYTVATDQAWSVRPDRLLVVLKRPALMRASAPAGPCDPSPDQPIVYTLSDRGVSAELHREESGRARLVLQTDSRRLHGSSIRFAVGQTSREYEIEMPADGSWRREQSLPETYDQVLAQIPVFQFEPPAGGPTTSPHSA